MKSSSYNLTMSAMFNGRKGERPPVGNPTSIVCHGLMDPAGVSFPDAHLDPVAFARAQFQAGADIVVLADHATGNLVGPYHYEELLLPIHQEITSQIDGPLILHVCGNCADRLELFARSGVDAYHFEWQVDAQTAVETVGNSMSLVGNVIKKDAAEAVSVARGFIEQR